MEQRYNTVATVDPNTGLVTAISAGTAILPIPSRVVAEVRYLQHNWLL